MRTKVFLEIHIFKAQQAGELLHSLAHACGPGKTILSCLAQALCASDNSARKLVGECPKWPSANMTREDLVLARALVTEAQKHLNILADWAGYAKEFASARACQGILQLDAA